ncbi:hypothetical protein HPB49_009831 [Dermacentor silvarum]|uniref:Uncharacterized protein n=1 Tax=Dermacentor silvarum TaxID=543639 RepID=A0ACB8C2Y0_DERSI|nr:hypothetical protein HPB49_009831 [Dermacentor silvarum]
MGQPWSAVSCIESRWISAICVENFDIGRMSVRRPIILNSEEAGLGILKKILTVCIVESRSRFTQRPSSGTPATRSHCVSREARVLFPAASEGGGAAGVQTTLRQG